MVSTQQNTSINPTEISPDNPTTQSASAETQPSVADQNLQNTTVTAESPAVIATVTAENTTVPSESPVGNTTVASSESSDENTTVTVSSAENSTSTTGTNGTGNANVTTTIDDETNNATATSVLADEDTSTEAGGFFLVSVGVGVVTDETDDDDDVVNIVVNNAVSQPKTGEVQLLDVSESDNAGEVKLSDNTVTVTDLYNSQNTPTYHDDLNEPSQTDEPGRIAVSNTRTEEIVTQNTEDDVTSSVLELLSGLTPTNTSRPINISEFEELDVRGISGKENVSSVERQDYAQSRSLKLGEGGNTEEMNQKEEEEEEVS